MLGLEKHCGTAELEVAGVTSERVKERLSCYHGHRIFIPGAASPDAALSEVTWVPGGWVSTYIHIYTYIHTYIRKYIHTHTYIHTSIYIYTYIHIDRHKNCKKYLFA